MRGTCADQDYKEDGGRVSRDIMCTIDKHPEVYGKWCGDLGKAVWWLVTVFSPEIVP